MAKRKAAKRTQRKARGRGLPGQTMQPLYPPTVEPQRPGVLITLGDGTQIYHGPPMGPVGPNEGNI